MFLFITKKFRGSYTVAGWRSGDDEKLMSSFRGNRKKGFVLCIQKDKL